VRQVRSQGNALAVLGLTWGLLPAHPALGVGESEARAFSDAARYRQG